MTDHELYDTVIIGGGPGGLTAGLYAARAQLKTLLLERLGFGGQLLTYETVENYPGFPEGINAFALGELISAHALKFGLQTRTAEVTKLEVDGPIKEVSLAEGRVIRSRTLIIATGASPNKLGIKGEAEYTGRGVSYCAVCDAPFYRNQDVAVVGGGDTAIEEAIYLSKFARRVHVIHRRDQLRATALIQTRAAQNEKISFLYNTVVTEIQGSQQGLEKLLIKDVKTGEVREFPVSGVFIFVGIQPNSGFLPSSIKRDPQGFVETDQDMNTSVPGVFAAGDVRAKSLRQIVTAVGDGATAAFNAGRYLENHFPK